MFSRAIASALAWLFSFLWKKEGKRMAAAISIGGKVVPLEDIELIAAAIPTALRDYASGKSAKEIMADLAPTLLSVSEDAANLICPGAGTAIGVIAYILNKSHPMSQTEINEWMSGPQGGGIGTQS